MCISTALSARKIRQLIKSIRKDISDDDELNLRINSNDLSAEFGAYVGRLKVLHPSHIQTIDDAEKHANSFYQQISEQRLGEDTFLDLWIQKISSIVEIGETLDKEKEKILPDYKELTNDIKKIRNDYDTMDGLFEEFGNMKDDLKEMIKDWKMMRKKEDKN